MKKKIEYMGYCEEGRSTFAWIAVQRKSGKMRFYRHLTESSMLRFQQLQDQCTSMDFSIVDKEVDLQIAMFFER